jgi:replication factor C subunit 3/5
MTTNEAIPWVEKYRPTCFDGIVLDDTNQSIFRNILDKQYFPNMLFYGPPGTGKTTTIMNLIGHHYERQGVKKYQSNVIHLNASDERGIDIIRNQIYQFVNAKNIYIRGIKFVILDEVDYMTKSAQQALKCLLQSSYENIRFCLICNYISKIDYSLKNEFLCIRFNQLPKLRIMSFLKNIINNENLEMTNDELDNIHAYYNSDIRSMINYLQLNEGRKFAHTNILKSCVLDDVHDIILSDATSRTCIQKIHDLAIKYNHANIEIVKKYLSHLLRAEKYWTSDFTEAMKRIIHTTHMDTENFMLFFGEVIRVIICKIEHKERDNQCNKR